MSVDVYIRTGLNIQVTPNASPSYVIGNLPVLVGASQQGATQGWVDSGYYPRDNPSGYATGVDGSLFVRHTESGVLLARGETGLFYPASNPSGFIAGQIAKFSVSLNSGVEAQTINYPTSLPSKPIAIACEMENNVDNLIYSHALTGVNNNGFTIVFSDVLSTTGYTLYTTINL